MRPIDFLITTVCCGVVAWLAYNFPAFSQGITIALLCVLWLTYLHSTITRLRHP